MPSAQLLLFPDPRPLVERLGRDFVQQMPETPGVYLMRDANDAVLYVGKARNLRKRLTSYRVANPDRMAKRHLRMLRKVTRIEIEICADESAALSRESELLRSLRPPFNRAGIWPAQPRFILWRRNSTHLELSVTDTAEPGWRAHGPMGSTIRILRPALIRLLWRAVHDAEDAIPAGWHQGLMANITRIECGELLEDAAAALESALDGDPLSFCGWIMKRQTSGRHPIENALVAEDLEGLMKVLGSHQRRASAATANNPRNHDRQRAA